MEELVAALSPHFSWIIIDTPPALAVTDAIDLARIADGVCSLLGAQQPRTASLNARSPHLATSAYWASCLMP